MFAGDAQWPRTVLTLGQATEGLQILRSPIMFHSALLCPILSYSVLLCSILFYSVLFCSILINSVRPRATQRYAGLSCSTVLYSEL